MRTFLTVFWLRRRLALRGLTSIAGAANLAAGIALALAAALGAVALAGGLGLVLHLAFASKDPDAIQVAWTSALYTIAFFALVVPIITGAGSSAFDPSRLLVFPISRGGLHHLALLTEFFSAPHLIWYPALIVSAVIGIVIPGPQSLSQLAVIGVFAIALVVWGHSISLVLRRWLRNRRLRELAAVIGLIGVVILSVAPAAVDITADNADERIGELLTVPPWIEQASRVLPPSIASRALTALRVGDRAAAVGLVGWLAGWLAAGWIIGRFALDGLLRSGATTGTTTTTAPESRLGRIRTRLLDRLTPPVGAVTAKELRYLLQSGTGRVSLLVMPVMTGLPALLAGRKSGMIMLGLDLQLVVFIGVMIYAAALTGHLQVNAFAWERSGISTYFTSPVRSEDIFLGKNLGLWILNLVLGVEGIIVWSFINGLPQVATVITSLLVLGSTTLLLSLLGNFTSVAFPESRPVSALTSSASPTGTLVMIGCLLVGVTLGGVVVFGAALADTPALQPVLAIGLFAAGVVAYRWSLSPAARVLCERRDEVFHDLGIG